MNLKFCEKILLLFNTDYSMSRVQIYPPHKRKNAERDKLLSSAKETHLIEVNNSGFTASFCSFSSKYYGAQVDLELDHPEFRKYSFLEGHSLLISTDTAGFSEIITNSSLEFGRGSGRIFSIDLYTNAWFQGCYRLVPDNSSFIPERIANYREFWESPKVSSMKPGSVYLNQWGDIYLALTDKVYSNTVGSGYPGGNGSYSLFYSWGSTLNYQNEKRSATVLAYLGNSKDILDYLPEIGKDCLSLQKFFEDLFQRSENHLSKFSIGANFLRLKGYSNGHFVKLLDIPGYESLYKSISGWKGLKEILFNISNRFDYDHNESVPHLEHYFYITSKKDDEDLGKILSNNEKSIYRNYVLSTIKSWKIKSSEYELKSYPRFYTPTKDDKKFTLDEINEFLSWRTRRSYLKVGIRDYWESSDTFLKLGLFKDENDLINEFEKIRKS